MLVSDHLFIESREPGNKEWSRQYVAISLDIFCSANREEHYEDNRLERLTSISTYRLDIGSRVPLTSDQLRGKEIVRHGLYIRRRSNLSNRF